MGIFDGILLVSDFDGTLALRGKIPEQNRIAIEHFMREGGRFSVGSGRYPAFLREHLGSLVCNAPLICCNGAIIAEQVGGSVLFSDVCDSSVYDMIADIFRLGLGYYEVRLYPPEASEAVFCTKAEFFSLYTSGARPPICKALLHTDTTEHGKRGAQAARELPYPALLGARSWDTSLEIMMRKNAKDRALLRLAKITGATYTVAVGDYENDVPMLCAANLSYAVRGGSEHALAAASKSCAPVECGAVADAIADLEAMILRGDLPKTKPRNEP